MLLENGSSAKTTAAISGERLLYDILERKENPVDVWGIPTPWDLVNRITGGIDFGHAVLVKGNSGVGKSIFVMQIALHIKSLLILHL